MIILLPFGLGLLATGLCFVLITCDVEVLDNQFRFRRFLKWKSVPLESIMKVRILGGVWVRVDYAGKRDRIFFSPEDYKLRPHPLPIIRFMQQVSAENAKGTSSAP